jgi:hypothetical protein
MLLSHRSEDSGFLEYDAASPSYRFLTFRRNLLPSYPRVQRDFFLDLQTLEDEGTICIRNVGNHYTVMLHIPEERSPRAIGRRNLEILLSLRLFTGRHPDNVLFYTLHGTLCVCMCGKWGPGAGVHRVLTRLCPRPSRRGLPRPS